MRRIDPKANRMKITKGTVVIGGQIYRAFELYRNGPWKVVAGTSYSDPTIASHIRAKSGKAALEQWVATLNGWA